MKLIQKAALPLFLACSFSALTPAIAETKREHGSHEHGVAQLRIAIEDNTWFVELESPLANILGFEHAPENEAQQALVEQSFATLNSVSSVVNFKGMSACKYSATEQIWPFNPADDHEEEHHEHHNEEKHEAHEHHNADDHKAHMEDPDHKHHDDHHDDKHSEHHEAHEHDETHGEVLVEWSFVCGDQKLPSDIQFPVMSEFEGMHSLQVEIIHPNAFVSKTITNAKEKVKLK